MAQKILNYLATIILLILFPFACWATIEMPSNCPPKFAIARATAKRTPYTKRTLNISHFMVFHRAKHTHFKINIEINKVVIEQAKHTFFCIIFDNLDGSNHRAGLTYCGALCETDWVGPSLG